MFMPINAKKVNFSEKEVNLVRLGCDLSKRAMYKLGGDYSRQYANFSADTMESLSYGAHNAAFHDMALEAAFERTGMDPTKTSVAQAFRMQNFSSAFFSVIEEVIDNVNSKNEIEEILTFADVRSIAEGDSMNIDVKATNAYFFYKTGRGKSFGQTQKYFGKNVTLTPMPAEATISFNRKDIVAGRFDWGREIARAIRGIRSGYLQDVAALVYSTSINPIGNKTINTGTWSELTFRTELQKVKAQNGSSNMVIFGTDIALAPILPTDNNLKLGLGLEYMDKGFIATQFGSRAVELPQALKADNETIIIPNDYVVGMSTDVSKPISIGISGETRIESMLPEQNATDDYVYNVKTDWDVKLAGQGRIYLAKTR